MTNATVLFAVSLPIAVVMLTAIGLYIRARRIEYRLAMESLERVFYAASQAASSETWAMPSTVTAVVRAFQTSVIFRQLSQTGVQRAVLIKALEDFGRRSTLATSVICDGLVATLLRVELKARRTPLTAKRCITVLKALFVPGIRKR